MKRATFKSRNSDGKTVIEIVPIPMSPVTMIFASLGLLANGIILFIFTACLAGGILGTSVPASAFVGIVCVGLFFVWSWTRKKKLIGLRNVSEVVISNDTLQLKRGAISATVPFAEVRRIRMANTLDDNLSPHTSIVVGGSTFEAGFAASIASVRAARIKSIAKTCFAVILDYGNDTATIADGLDEITCQNIFDDLASAMHLRA